MKRKALHDRIFLFQSNQAQSSGSDPMIGIHCSDSVGATITEGFFSGGDKTMKNLQPWHRNPKIAADCGHIVRAENARYCDIEDNVKCETCADKEWKEGHIHVNFQNRNKD